MADDGDGDCGGDGGVSLKERVSKDWVVVVRDPEMPRGHKSSQRGHDGHMAAVVDNNIPLVTVVDVPLVIAWHSMGELNQVKQSEGIAGAPVVEPVGDAACGDSQEFCRNRTQAGVPGPGGSNSKQRLRNQPGARQWHLSCGAGN